MARKRTIPVVDPRTGKVKYFKTHRKARKYAKILSRGASRTHKKDLSTQVHQSSRLIKRRQVKRATYETGVLKAQGKAPEQIKAREQAKQKVVDSMANLFHEKFRHEALSKVGAPPYKQTTTKPFDTSRPTLTKRQDKTTGVLIPSVAYYQTGIQSEKPKQESLLPPPEFEKMFDKDVRPPPTSTIDTVKRVPGDIWNIGKSLGSGEVKFTEALTTSRVFTPFKDTIPGKAIQSIPLAKQIITGKKRTFTKGFTKKVMKDPEVQGFGSTVGVIGGIAAATYLYPIIGAAATLGFTGLGLQKIGSGLLNLDSKKTAEGVILAAPVFFKGVKAVSPKISKFNIPLKGGKSQSIFSLNLDAGSRSQSLLALKPLNFGKSTKPISRRLFFGSEKVPISEKISLDQIKSQKSPFTPKTAIEGELAARFIDLQESHIARIKHSKALARKTANIRSKFIADEFIRESSVLKPSEQAVIIKWAKVNQAELYGTYGARSQLPKDFKISKPGDIDLTLPKTSTSKAIPKVKSLVKELELLNERPLGDIRLREGTTLVEINVKGEWKTGIDIHPKEMGYGAPEKAYGIKFERWNEKIEGVTTMSLSEHGVRKTLSSSASIGDKGVYPASRRIKDVGHGLLTQEVLMESTWNPLKKWSIGRSLKKLKETYPKEELELFMEDAMLEPITIPFKSPKTLKIHKAPSPSIINLETINLDILPIQSPSPSRSPSKPISLIPSISKPLRPSTSKSRSPSRSPLKSPSMSISDELGISSISPSPSKSRSPSRSPSMSISDELSPSPSRSRSPSPSKPIIEITDELYDPFLYRIKRGKDRKKKKSLTKSKRKFKRTATFEAAFEKQFRTEIILDEKFTGLERRYL